MDEHITLIRPSRVGAAGPIAQMVDVRLSRAAGSPGRACRKWWSQGLNPDPSDLKARVLSLTSEEDPPFTIEDLCLIVAP